MEISHYLKYDESAPSCLVWIAKPSTRSNRVVAGTPAGCLRSDGYYDIGMLSKHYLSHRLVWEMFNGSLPEGMQVDHINGDRSDNRIINLRSVPSVLNARNQKYRCTNSSGVTGVNIETSGCGRYCFVIARWMDNGKKCQKGYNVHKYGIMVAFKLAVIKRQSEIDRMIACGAGYTTSHGKR